MSNTKNYFAHGGNELVIGGKLTFLPMTRKRAPAYKIGGQHEESIFRSLPCAGQAP